MADYQNPQQSPDPAGNTQMFRAFVDDGSTTAHQAPQPSAGAPVTYGSARGNSRSGLIIALIAAVVVIAAVVYFAVA